MPKIESECQKFSNYFFPVISMYSIQINPVYSKKKQGNEQPD
jgi:hypothetical protein